MGEQTGGACLGLEASQEFGARQARALFTEANGFDGDGAANHRIGGFINDTHGAAAKFTDNFVTSRSYHRRHEWRHPSVVTP